VFTVFRNPVQPAFAAEVAESKVWVTSMVPAFAGWTAIERHTTATAAATVTAKELRMDIIGFFSHPGRTTLEETQIVSTRKK